MSDLGIGDVDRVANIAWEEMRSRNVWSPGCALYVLRHTLAARGVRVSARTVIRVVSNPLDTCIMDEALRLNSAQSELLGPNEHCDNTDMADEDMPYEDVSDEDMSGCDEPNTMVSTDYLVAIVPLARGISCLVDVTLPHVYLPNAWGALDRPPLPPFTGLYPGDKPIPEQTGVHARVNGWTVGYSRFVDHSGSDHVENGWILTVR